MSFSQLSRNQAQSATHRQQGSMLIMVTLLLLLASLMVATLVGNTTVRQRASAETVNTSNAVYVAEGAVDFAQSSIWDAYEVFRGGQTNTIAVFKSFLDAAGPYQMADGGSIDIVDQLPDLGILVTSLVVTREDLVGGQEVELTVSATVDNSGTETTYVEVLRAEGAPFSGMNFDMLTNDVNCMFCHAEFDSVAKYDPNLTSYEGVRVASLEALKVRNTGDSTIAGKLYIRGSFTDNKGNPLTSMPRAVMEGYQMDAAGNILVSPTGDKYPKALEDDVDFFRDYPVAAVDQAAGQVPDSFPPVFPDLDNDGMVGDAEFDSIAAASTGAITGGVIQQLNHGSSFTGTALPTTGNVSQVSQNVNGNMVLVGTKSNPIELNDRVAIDGDIVIQGYVKGSGTLWARGNIYVVGDLQYLDGTDAAGNRTYGTATDGTVNSLGLAAGGNIVAGNYLNGYFKSPYDKTYQASGGPEDINNGRMGFTAMEMAIFNRREFAKTQQYLPDATGQQVANPQYDPTYTPRFYAQNNSSDIVVFLGGNGATFDASANTWAGSDFGKSHWDSTKGEWGGSEHPKKWIQNMVIPRADFPAGWNVVTTSPATGWLSEDQLWSIWDTYENNKGNEDPMNIDAVLYTNNGIFALASKQGKYAGKMVVNGAVVARDTGMLATRSLNINYDERTAKKFGIIDYTEVRLFRKGMRITRDGSSYSP
ncbi:MAG: hypothetical protein AAF581_01625 [Planctomycetota bacterium]